MSSETKWLTLSEAAKLPDVPVTGETLRQMIQRGEVPEGYWMSMPFGEKVIFYIDESVLNSLDYRGRGKRGKGKNKP